MTEEIQIFNFEEKQVRTIEINGEPWFVGKDVAIILGYKDLNRAVNQHVDREDRKALSRKGSGDSYPTLWNSENDWANKVVVNESGIYSLIFGSQLPTAKKFKRWVTNEVLPTIRKHGAYLTDQKIDEILSDPNTIIKLATELKEERAKSRALLADNEKMKPKALFADSVSASHSTILIRELAKILKGNGINIGGNRLFQWLRDNGYLISCGSDRNTPTQMAMNLGVFKVKESTIARNGDVTIVKTTMVTGKGQQYFINKFLKMKDTGMQL